MHEAVIDFVQRQASQHGLDIAEIRVLDIGGRHTPTRYYNGTQPFELFKACYEYLVLDKEPGPDVDIVADATRPMDLGQLGIDDMDVVVCTEVLEHVKDWIQLLQTAYDALRTGGRLILTCAGPGRRPHPATTDDMDPAPDEFYANVSPMELRQALIHVGFRDVITYQVGFDTQATAVK